MPSPLALLFDSLNPSGLIFLERRVLDSFGSILKIRIECYSVLTIAYFVLDPHVESFQRIRFILTLFVYRSLDRVFLPNQALLELPSSILPKSRSSRKVTVVFLFNSNSSVMLFGMNDPNDPWCSLALDRETKGRNKYPPEALQN
ncbi:hypothetical protein VNO77_19937 [Canavalia gladiata]|uniref:Uncharacterized protein n=1 Tax=Canavalia gladiata TaxID=3824 RepID=A0AAN9LNE6_CANGL